MKLLKMTATKSFFFIQANKHDAARLFDLPKNSVMQNLGSQVLTENLSLLSWLVTQKTTLASWKKCLKLLGTLILKLLNLELTSVLISS